MKPGAGHPTQAEYVRLLHFTLEGISSQATAGDAQETARLKNGLSTLSRRIDERSTSEEIETALTEGLEFVREFNLAGAKHASDRLVELRAVMRAMTETITFLSESRTTAVHQLTHIERQLEQASELEDIRLLRPRLMSCLELVREETARLHSESAADAEKLRSQSRTGTLDRVTGLPGREVAERLLAERIISGKDCSLALFVPQRLASVTKRHGSGAEDEILLHVAQHLAKQLPASVSLCRWTGPGLLALAEAQSGSGDPERLWTHLASRQIEQTIQLDRRTVLMRITLVNLVKQVSPGMSLPSVFADLDEFVMTSTREL